jgi:hypothetical protein
MAIGQSATAYEPRLIELGETNKWCKVLPRNGARATLLVANEEATTDARVYLPSAASFDDPFCGDFNGSSAYVAVNALPVSHTKFGACTAGSIEARILLAAAADERIIIGFSDASVSNTHIKFGFDATDHLFAEASLAGVVQWTVTADDVTLEGGWLKVMLVHDGIRPTLYADGANIAQTRTGDYQTKWFSTITGLDEAAIGAVADAGTEGGFFQGKIDWLQVRDLNEGGKASLAEWHFDDTDATAVTTVADHAKTFGAEGDTALTAGVVTDATIVEKSNGRLLPSDSERSWSADDSGDNTEIHNSVWVKSTISSHDIVVYETRRM